MFPIADRNSDIVSMSCMTFKWLPAAFCSEITTSAIGQIFLRFQVPGNVQNADNRLNLIPGSMVARRTIVNNNWKLLSIMDMESQVYYFQVSYHLAYKYPSDFTEESAGCFAGRGLPLFLFHTVGVYICFIVIIIIFVPIIHSVSLNPYSEKTSQLQFDKEESFSWIICKLHKPKIIQISNRIISGYKASNLS